MATGYTYPVRAGQITDFSTFAWFCAKGIDVFCRDRDTNRPIGWIPTEAELAEICGDNDRYYEKQIVFAKKELLELQGRDDEAWREAHSASSERRKCDYEQKVRENKIIYERYTSMLSKVADWIPPTDAHKRMKEFMIEQLKESIDRDCTQPILCETETLEEYKYEMIAIIERRIARCEEGDLAGNQEVKKRRDWIIELAQSLGQEIR